MNGRKDHFLCFVTVFKHLQTIHLLKSKASSEKVSKMAVLELFTIKEDFPFHVSIFDDFQKEDSTILRGNSAESTKNVQKLFTCGRTVQGLKGL